MTGPYVSVAVEGTSDAAAVEAILDHVGLALAKPPVVKHGVKNLDKFIGVVARAQASNPWVVFRDSDGACPVELRERILRADAGNPYFQLRLARPMIEAWLLADARGFAGFFRVPVAKVPRDPDTLAHAKRELVALCLKSTSRNIRDEVCRPDGRPGPRYVDWLNRFARERWDVGRAAAASESLERAVGRLSSMRALLASP